MSVFVSPCFPLVRLLRVSGGLLLFFLFLDFFHFFAEELAEEKGTCGEDLLKCHNEPIMLITVGN